MPHTTIATDGAIVYRTKLMEAERAAAFARMIGANATRFEAVQIVPSNGKTERFYITFRPVSAAKQSEMYQAEYDKNADRATIEGADYLFWKDPDSPYRIWVFNPKSGETYPMDKGFCQCPQAEYRCRKAALHCKHEIEFDNRLAARVDPFGTDKQTPAVPAAPAATLALRFAAAGLRPDLDF
jgi:predicted nucleic acid-binding Zn finger protein